LGYYTVQSIKRLCTPHNNSKAQLEHGGLPISLPYLLISMFHAVSSILHSIHITYLSAGLHRIKLKEFLDLEQGNHNVFNYTRQFNTLAQYGSYHIDTDEKKADLYHVGLTIHLQEHLIQFANLSYN
jgi:hypothetical protein